LRLLTLIIASLSVFLSTCSETPSALEQVRARGVLRVVTRFSPVTYYEGANGPAGAEFEMVRGLARDLGVRLEIYTTESFSGILPQVIEGKADLAAAALTVTEDRKSRVLFSTPYKTTSEHVIYRVGTLRPRKLDDIVGGAIEVLAGSSHAESLNQLRQQNPDLTWLENSDTEVEDLLFRVSSGELSYTVADTLEFNVARNYHPDIRIGMDLDNSHDMAWAFRKSDDYSLLEVANAYLFKIHENGTMARVEERYFGHTRRFDYVGTRTFLRDIDQKLPSYRYLFEQVANELDLDWRLLAAVSYQESHWNPAAKSPTGVRGMMMLTLATAKQMEVKNRKDPQQSIRGGARYLERVKSKIPDRIPEPDRTWLALAAYNVGWGHLEDARIITEMRGENPDSWRAVKESLPLLTQKQWYKQVKRGYARGWEPVRYVENVRSYLDILKWKTATSNPRRLAPLEPDAGDFSGTDLVIASP
jgi:membrane-bound lytic murein transglycosylase F